MDLIVLELQSQIRSGNAMGVEKVDNNRYRYTDPRTFIG